MEGHTKHEGRDGHDGRVVVADHIGNDDRAATTRGGPEEQFGAPISAPSADPNQRDRATD